MVACHIWVIRNYYLGPSASLPYAIDFVMDHLEHICTVQEVVCCDYLKGHNIDKLSLFSLTSSHLDWWATFMLIRI